jgi:hypothetical protein
MVIMLGEVSVTSKELYRDVMVEKSWCLLLKRLALMMKVGVATFQLQLDKMVACQEEKGKTFVRAEFGKTVFEVGANVGNPKDNQWVNATVIL